MPTSSAANLEPRYTWDDYLTWPESERWELIGGEAYSMSPSPTFRHQDISLSLGSHMRVFFKGKKCSVVAAPMDVKLSEEDVVQPDLLVVCDPNQIKQRVEGPPSLVIEILSDLSISHDRILKTELYARFGVKEYWIVTPFPGVVEVLLLQGEKYTLWKAFGRKDILTCPSFPDMKIELADVFDYPLEPHEQALFAVKESPAPYPYAKR